MPNITFQTLHLFEKIIKSCQASNLEFLKLKEKLGLCLYEGICDEQQFISMLEDILKEENIFSQHDVQNEKCESKK